MDQVTRNKNMYDADLSKHDCGYWSVCDDKACPFLKRCNRNLK